MSCSVTLPRWGTMQRGELSARTMPERLISGTGSGFGVSWPTPDTRGFTNDGALGLLAEACDSFEEMSGMAYRKQLKRKAEYWPTPTVACATGGQTSRSGDRKGELLLAGAVKQWPTPRAEGHGMINLNDTIGGSLNPTWVEFLMGWPLLWTSMDPLPPETWAAWLRAFRIERPELPPLAMDKFQQWQHSHGGF